jgi:hypothetical protein
MPACEHALKTIKYGIDEIVVERAADAAIAQN